MRPDFGDPRLAERLRAADPLGADPLLARLPGMNAAADLNGLRDTTIRLCSAAGSITAPEPALAAVRDLGLLLGSIRRHGPEPVELVPGLEEQLLRLAGLTGLAPRDLILHYTVWNPKGERERRYTGDPMESALIDSVRIVDRDLAAAINLTAVLHGVPDVRDLPRESLDRLGQHLSSMVRAMDLVIGRLDPSFFFTGIRPYLDPVRIAGRDWYGPAASQMPIWLLDQALWAGGHGDEEYTAFAGSMIPYSLPEWSAYYRAWSTGPSLGARIGRAVEAEARAGRSSSRLAGVEAAFVGVVRVLITFRGRHLGVTRRAYAGAPDSLGSGGGSMDLLRRILELSRDNGRRLRPG